MIAVVAEKPSVARDLAAVLGASTRGPGCLRGNGYVVTWAIGHLVGIAEPHQMNPRWKRWDLEDLPILPTSWPLHVLDETRAQFEHVERVLLDPEVREVIAATDAGREGELIFRYVYRKTGCEKPVKRLWISSLTPDAIRRGFRDLKSLGAFDPLARAAVGRSRADWLVGMNLSRVYSLAEDDHLSVGRVQTPTLAMVVGRENEIRAFVPEDYLEVWATFEASETPAREERFDAAYVGPKDGATKPKQAKRFAVDAEEAHALVARAKRGRAEVAEVVRETKRIPPPLLYDLTELQRHANRLYGMSAKETLDTAQALYERHKLLSYPRTDSRHLSSDVATTVPEITRAIASSYRHLLPEGALDRPLPTRFVDDREVGDHHAILPTPITRGSRSLSQSETLIYDLVCRRLLQAFCADHHLAITTVLVDVTSEAHVDRFRTSGESVEQLGWKALDVGGDREAKKKRDGEETMRLPPGLERGRPLSVADARARKKTTKPPPRFSDATLLTAMESAGRALDDKELAAAMRQEGLGTPATRAQTLETLLARGYVVRDGKVLQATEKGIRLIERVDEAVKSPILTGQWEARLARMERGEEELAPFLKGIEELVRQIVERVRGGAPAATAGRARVSKRDIEPRPDPATRAAERRVSERDVAPSPRATRVAPAVSKRDEPASVPFERGVSSRDTRSDSKPFSALIAAPLSPASLARAAPPARPATSSDLDDLLARVFGFPAFRPTQREVCQTVTGGRDALLVMPTGAGKSLCYQLPGLARGGTTLVVSPLIALMDDQADKLLSLGLRAERVHSGRGRDGSRAASRAYLAGELDFLFIAPERLKVPGFVEMLAKRPPSLLAIDEAHCISQWGHDFRPDYRLLGDSLISLRGAPILALTATATPAVQDDIVKQLGLRDAARFIQGFRRENLGVEIVEMNPGERASAVKKLLSDRARRPAIVYAPTRKVTEQMTKELEKKLRVGAYHAGLPAKEREDVQRAFLAGDVDVIVATIAFGMGIDKANVRTVIHAGLPQTVEGYYQEIGRAGRDGLPSRAVLLHSFVDTKTHEFFLERDYPASHVLATLYDALRTSPRGRDELARDAALPADDFEKALEKLWLHGGATGTPEETFSRGSPDWKRSYEAQRAHRESQLRQMQKLARGTTCRMRALVAHFGDDHDAGHECGVCDVCDPKASVAQDFRAPSTEEMSRIETIFRALHERDGLTVGQLHRELEPQGVDRRALEHMLASLAKARAVRMEDDEFEKDGKTISFRRVFLGAVRPNDVAMPSAPVVRRAKVPRPKHARTKPRRSEPRGTPSLGRLHEELKAWRLVEAKRRGVPAFRVLTDRALLGIVNDGPTTERALLAIPGIGPSVAKKHGAALLAIVRRSGG